MRFFCRDCGRDCTEDYTATLAEEASGLVRCSRCWSRYCRKEQARDRRVADRWFRDTVERWRAALTGKSE